MKISAGIPRLVFYDRAFRVAALLFPRFLRSRNTLLETPLELDEAYRRAAREAVRASEFLVIEFYAARQRSDPGGER